MWRASVQGASEVLRWQWHRSAHTLVREQSVQSTHNQSGVEPGGKKTDRVLSNKYKQILKVWSVGELIILLSRVDSDRDI